MGRAQFFPTLEDQVWTARQILRGATQLRRASWMWSTSRPKYLEYECPPHSRATELREGDDHQAYAMYAPGEVYELGEAHFLSPDGGVDFVAHKDSEPLVRWEEGLRSATLMPEGTARIWLHMDRVRLQHKSLMTEEEIRAEGYEDLDAFYCRYPLSREVEWWWVYTFRT